MNIFITGGAGFIGSNLADHHMRQGHHVVVFDNLSRKGTDTNLAWLRENHGDKLSFVKGDIRDFEALRAALPADTARLYHMASQVAVTTSVANPREDFEINAWGTFNVLEAVRAAAPQAVVFYASTNKVYGGMEEVAVVEGETCYRYRDLPLGIPETQLLDFHSPYGCCYSADTDILTREGWKRFYDLDPQDQVLTYNIERKVAEYQTPTNHFAYPYKGKMYAQTNRRLKTCVTPNHKMLVSWDCNHDELEHPHLIEAQSLQGKTMAYLLAANVEDGEERDYFILPGIKAGKHKHTFKPLTIPMDDWLRFLGWYISEGHCYEDLKTVNCTVTLTTYYRTDEAVAVMRAIGLSPVVDHHHITATSRQLYEYVKSLGKSHDKYIPPDIKKLSRKHLRVLLKSLLDGDGDKKSKNGWRYTTVSPRLADDVQEIAIRCGMAASVSLDKEGFYRVYISTTRTAQCNQGQDRSEWVDYDGMVYCVEVPNSVVMVRQNGRAYFSGNSKGCGDQYVRDYARIYGLCTVVFRQSCIYGTRQFGVEDQGWVAHFCIAARLGRPLTIYGDGKQVRDVLWIDDLVAAYDAAAARIDVASGKIYNVGGGPANTMSIWVEFGPILQELAGHPIPVTYSTWRPGDQPVYVSDIRKAERELGWRPHVSVREGIERLWRWIDTNPGLFG
ncbi:MAG: SDR family NAD(P)-dependent oxidoreductase [Thermoflexales bacterium]|nr:SDR family NAD(P)-dependent oxidoreductase [Thermoflexales bacterium]